MVIISRHEGFLTNFCRSDEPVCPQDVSISIAVLPPFFSAAGKFADDLVT